MATTGIQIGQPFDQIYVALDLETTGLSPQRDEIIEIGAVKFSGGQQLETYQTIVNPHRELPVFIQRLTGLSQDDVDTAPSIREIRADLEEFVRGTILVGHNVSFDLAFLTEQKIELPTLVYDTKDLAGVIFPTNADTSLVGLCLRLELEHIRPHRALDDAQATRHLFLTLLDWMMEVWPLELISRIRRVTSQSEWGLRSLFSVVEDVLYERKSLGRSSVTALSQAGLRERPRVERPLEPQEPQSPIEENVVRSLFAPDGPIARTFSQYELRQGQIEMAVRVAHTIGRQEKLLLEGGTGVGKSLAYLVPGLLYALENDLSILVSTNTINLQDQITSKDIPRVLTALRKLGFQSKNLPRISVLKGRTNYVCVRRLHDLDSVEWISIDQAKLAAKVLVWVEGTLTGDRAELSLRGPELAAWALVSSSPSCLREDKCFMKAARERAQAAHLTIVNHSLLLSDAARGGGLLPDSKVLIIDEAHHLEEEATRQFGFQLSATDFTERFHGTDGVGETAARALALSSDMTIPISFRNRLSLITTELNSTLSLASDKTEEIFELFRNLIVNESVAMMGRPQLAITAAIRSGKAWKALHNAWEELDQSIDRIQTTLDDLDAIVVNLDSQEGRIARMAMSIHDQSQEIETIRKSLFAFVSYPTPRFVYWISLEGQHGISTLNGAPLEIAAILERHLFSPDKPTILTSATLTIGESFDHIRQQLGMLEAEESRVESPFDYERSVLLSLPQDIPEPNQSGYMEAVQGIIEDLGLALGGRSMVLCTSHSALRTLRHGIAPTLEEQGIFVLGQGVDGSPNQILRRFMENPKAVILGTASLWEGVDIPDGLLKAIVVVRLPFGVPTDPVFSARGNQFEDPFSEYALPHAVLRFRQGFGRLIRRREDRGAVIVLDRRIGSRGYGKTFLRSIPKCTVSWSGIRGISREVHRWIEG